MNMILHMTLAHKGLQNCFAHKGTSDSDNHGPEGDFKTATTLNHSQTVVNAHDKNRYNTTCRESSGWEQTHHFSASALDRIHQNPASTNKNIYSYTPTGFQAKIKYYVLYFPSMLLPTIQVSYIIHSVYDFFNLPIQMFYHKAFFELLQYVYY